MSANLPKQDFYDMTNQTDMEEVINDNVTGAPPNGSQQENKR